MRAHLAGAIDFREARLLDVNWWRRTNVILRAMTADRDLEVLKSLYSFQRALLGNARLTDESFKKFQDGARDTCNDIISLLRPWAAQSAESVKQREVNDLIATYKREIGDPSDPVFRAKMEAMAAEADRKVVPTETEDDRVSRLYHEAEAERERRLAAAVRRR